MEDQAISLPPSEMGDFMYIPKGLTLGHVERVLSAHRKTDVRIVSCREANLCLTNWGHVSCSGSTVLRLSLTLDEGSVDVVVKILSPDAVNLFKVDRCFESRLFELTLVRWWSEQSVPYAPVVYDTRMDVTARELWFITEHFPSVGWGDRPERDKCFGNDVLKLEQLMDHVADLHAYTHSRMDELLALFPPDRRAVGHLCPPSYLLEQLTECLGDASLLSEIGLTSDERALLGRCCRAIEKRPNWVDGGEIVCVNSDIGYDNIAVRQSASKQHLVSFDWGVTHLGAMEEEFRVLLPRLPCIGDEQKGNLLRHYLKAFAARTGVVVDPEVFERRIPWGALRVTLRYIVEHVNALRWVGWQTRSKFLISRFLEESERILKQLSFS
jgi:hypothetical protein